MAWAAACTLLVAGGCAPNRIGILPTLPHPLTRTRLGMAPTGRMHGQVPTSGAAKTSTGPAGSAWRPPGGISDRWNAIVIHHSGSSGGSAASFDRYHRDVQHWDELGYHFVIGNGNGSGDGEIEVGTRWAKQKHGAHCKSPDNYYNRHGIGICLVGDFRYASPTPAQLVSLTRLVRFLESECGMSPEQVVTHRAVTGKTICPGPKFSLLALRRSVLLNRGASVLR